MREQSQGRQVASSVPVILVSGSAPSQPTTALLILLQGIGGHDGKMHQCPTISLLHLYPAGEQESESNSGVAGAYHVLLNLGCKSCPTVGSVNVQTSNDPPCPRNMASSFGFVVKVCSFHSQHRRYRGGYGDLVHATLSVTRWVARRCDQDSAHPPRIADARTTTGKGAGLVLDGLCDGTSR